MIIVEKFKPEHILLINEQEATAYLGEEMIAERAKSLALDRLSYSVFKKDTGRLLLCFGIVEQLDGHRGEGWAIFDKVCREEFMALHSVVKRFVESRPVRRIEATVRKDFENGHRWMRALGFELEAPTLKAYCAQGLDYSLYARVG